MGIFGWILLGLLVGTISRALVPGRTEPGGCIGTTAVGILGALIGGLIASALDLGEIDDFFDLGTWLIAIGGSVLLLLVLRAISGPGGRLADARMRSLGAPIRFLTPECYRYQAAPGWGAMKRC